jgi:hypothetical protein
VRERGVGLHAYTYLGFCSGSDGPRGF